ncbi:MAG: hypothetical protein J5602_02835 [Clostridia bacterium]|nr:hypothetical protein [Clostridia bacterium]
MKKILTVLLVMAMVLTMMSGIAMADGDREPITITMLSLPANVSGTLEGTWWTDYLFEELGITLELVPGSSDDDKLLALVAADALPDMVIFHNGTQLKNCVDAEQLLALDDFADIMPNAQKYMKTAMNYYADAFTTDGKCYAIANLVGPAKPSLNWSTAIRWDLYKQIGSPEIKTTWDYLDVLKQMQDIYPENEDGQKVYAITAWNDWDSITMHNAQQFSLLSGVDSGDQLGGKLPFAQVDFNTLELTTTLRADSAYIDGLKWYFTANQMGILDPDSMTQNWNNALEKGNAGRVLFGWWMWAVDGYNTPERVNADEPTGFATVLPTESKVPMSFGNVIGTEWCWSVSHNAVNPERCAEYIDFMCNPDKTFILYNGPKGETWDLNDEGKPYLTETGLLARQDPTYLLAGGDTLGHGTSVINSNPVSSGTVSELYGAPQSYTDWETYVPTTTKLEDEVAAVTGYTKTVDYLLANGNYVALPLANSFIAPLPDDMQMLKTQIGDVVSTQSWLAVYAADEDEFNAIVEQMIADAEELGLADMMAYDEQAWAAAIEKAARYE